MGPLDLGELFVRRVERRLDRTVGGTGHATSRRAALELELQTRLGDQTFIGRGEAAPLPGYSVDSIDEVELALQGLAGRLGSLAVDDRLLPSLARRTEALPPAARFAFETACLDAAGQALGRPLWALLGGSAPRPLPLTCAFEPARAERLLADGYRVHKLKIDPGELHKLDDLSALPAGLRLRIDGNRSFSPSELEPTLARLCELGPKVELVEEPLDGDFADWLAGAPPPLPYAVDESLAARSTEAALAALDRYARAMELGRLAAVVVKPGRDGLLGAGVLALAAQASGVPVVVGHLWDGPIGHLAACHLAFAVAGPTPIAQGLGPQPGSAPASHDDAPARALAALFAGGALLVPAAPGLAGSP